MKKKIKQSIEDEAESVEEESQASENEREVDLDVSITESDEDGDSDEEEDKEANSKTRAEKIEEEILNKYEQLKGTRLYVRFPQKLPEKDKEFEAKVKALHPLIVKASKPRQKHARFCLVDFKSKEDRDAALADIQSAIESDADFKGIFISIPKTDSDDFVNELVARKQQSLEKRYSKNLLKRASKQVNRKKIFTSSVVITNLPKTGSVAQVRKLFQNAIDIQVKPGKGKHRDFNAATVTLPTTMDARNAIKQELSIGGTKLKLRFNTQKPRSNMNLKRKAPAADNGDFIKIEQHKKAKKAVKTDT